MTGLCVALFDQPRGGPIESLQYASVMVSKLAGLQYYPDPNRDKSPPRPPISEARRKQPSDGVGLRSVLCRFVDLPKLFSPRSAYIMLPWIVRSSFVCQFGISGLKILGAPKCYIIERFKMYQDCETLYGERGVGLIRRLVVAALYGATVAYVRRDFVAKQTDSEHPFRSTSCSTYQEADLQAFHSCHTERTSKFLMGIPWEDAKAAALNLTIAEDWASALGQTLNLGQHSTG